MICPGSTMPFPSRPEIIDSAITPAPRKATFTFASGESSLPVIGPTSFLFATLCHTRTHLAARHRYATRKLPPHAEPTRKLVQPVSPPAPGQPGRLVSVG